MNRKALSGILLTLLLISMLTLVFNIMLVEATSTIIYVDPKTSMALPGETFTVNINIAEVEDYILGSSA